MESEYPRWIYHKTLPAKIVNSKEDHDREARDGWRETPAAFDQESDETGEQTPADQSESQQGQAPIDEADFAKMTKAQLIAYLVEKGIEEKSLKGLNKDELIAKVGDL